MSWLREKFKGCFDIHPNDDWMWFQPWVIGMVVSLFLVAIIIIIKLMTR